MIKRQYHCLVAGLPALFPDTSRLASSLAEWKDQLREDLHPDDFLYIRQFFLRFDNHNVYHLLSGNSKVFNPLGNYSREHIEEVMLQLKDEDTNVDNLDFPVYLSGFIRAFKAETPLFPEKSWENQLSQLYFGYLAGSKNAFIREWFGYELDMTNIITAINCRKHQADVRKELVGENEITGKLVRSNARDFGISNEFPYLESILRAAEETDLLEKEKKFDLIRWKYLDDQVFFYYFTIEYIFTYIIKLEMISRWLQLDKPTGEKLFRELLGSMKTSYKFPEEFTI
jgi:vacuolar-type H+-ATPase subunit C/Vma6